MSKGPGAIERRIADLFATTRDRALSIEEIASVAFTLTPSARPSRSQRLSATRAAHRLLRRVREQEERADQLFDKAHANTKAALGREERRGKRDEWDKEYQDRLKSDSAWIEREKLQAAADRVGTWVRIVDGGRPGWRKAEYDFWCTATLKGRLWFHPPDVP